MSSHTIDQNALASPIVRLRDYMRSYFDAKSRPQSPSMQDHGRRTARADFYSTPPDLKNHNIDILRVFLGMFRKHIPKTFGLFHDPLEAQYSHSIENLLAMAALGGLFCTVAGSDQIANSMYNDSRRLCLEASSCKGGLSGSAHDTLEIVKTQLLLGLYGLCSGDKRSYEFVEAFQGHLTHTLRMYAKSCHESEFTPEDDLQIARLFEAVQIFDCYRVVIMTRPPSLMSHLLGKVPSSLGTEFEAVRTRAGILVQHRASSDTAHQQSTSFPALTSLAVHLWPAMYSRQNHYKGEDVLVEGLHSGNADFVESALERWYQVYPQGSPSCYSDHIVYHMMHIMLHTNVTILQIYAQSAPGSFARDPTKSTTAREVCAWIKDHHYVCASWHAEQLTALVENNIQANSDNRTTRRSMNSLVEGRRLAYEAPHVPYALYYASLILWCRGAVTSEKTASAQTRAPLVRGERILSLHKLHAAQLLASVLGEVV
jgi:hypothetical protein